MDPEENKRAGKNDTIILKVSRGGYFTVENYVGMTLPELREIFSSNHVNIRIQQSEVPRSDVQKEQFYHKAYQSERKLIH